MEEKTEERNLCEQGKEAKGFMWNEGGREARRKGKREGKYVKEHVRKRKSGMFWVMCAAGEDDRLCSLKIMMRFDSELRYLYFSLWRGGSGLWFHFLIILSTGT